MIYDLNGSAKEAAFSLKGESLPSCYKLTGEQVELEGGGVNYDSYTVTESLDMNVWQGVAYYGGLLFIFNGGDACTIVDYQTGETLQTLTNITQGHGNSANFSTEFFDPSDEFPLLYVSKDQGSPCDVFVYRVQRANNAFTLTLVRTLRFSLSEVFYYANGCVDENNVLYMYAYSENDYSTNANNNHMVITTWDLNTLTENGDGTYKPAYIGRVDAFNFVSAHCNQSFHDGYIVTGSGYTYNAYLIDPQSGAIMYIFPTRAGSELEGAVFISDNEMLVGYRNYRPMWLYTFD